MAEQASQTEYISQEQRETQSRYDLGTQFAELIDGNMRTSFDLYFNGEGLIGEDGREMSEVANVAIDVAQAAVQEHPELLFEVRRRKHEDDEIEEATDMARGQGPNTMIIASDFPEELMYAQEDVGGYNVTRKQTMLRVLTRQPDGNIHIYSQSLDGSNRQALEAIYQHFGRQPKPGELLGQRIRADLSDQAQAILVDELTGIYDRSLSAQYGGQWYAGRRPSDYRNTYEFVCQQQDLLSECVRLKKQGWLNDDIMYKMSAAMQKRFDAGAFREPINNPVLLQRHPVVNPEMLYREINLAGDEAKQLDTTFSACGITLSARGLENSTENQMEQSGYGNKAINEDGDCEFVSKKCPECKEKDVKTKVHKLPSGKKIISGSCGCAVIR